MCPQGQNLCVPINWDCSRFEGPHRQADGDGGKRGFRITSFMRQFEFYNVNFFRREMVVSSIKIKA
jgi:hypothetical protein